MPAAKVAKAEEIAPGKMKVFEIAGRRVAVCNVDGAVYAIEDLCTHDDGPLDQGAVEGGEVECPRHGARFDVRTGAATKMPAIVPVRTFPVTVEGGEIAVEVSE